MWWICESWSVVIVVFMIMVMIVGRVGPLTLAYVVTRQRPTRLVYADEEVATG